MQLWCGINEEIFVKLVHSGGACVVRLESVQLLTSAQVLISWLVGLGLGLHADHTEPAWDSIPLLSLFLPLPPPK